MAKLKTGEKKKIYGHFIREMPDKTDWDKTLQWLSKNDLIWGLQWKPPPPVHIMQEKRWNCATLSKWMWEIALERIQETTRQCRKENQLRPL